MSGDMHVPGEGMIWAPSGNAGRSWVVQKRPCSRVVTSFSSTPSCRPWLGGLLLPSLRIGVDRDFDTAIQLPPTLGVIDSDRLGLATANCLQPPRVHALRGEVIPRCHCASLGERLVVLTGSDGVRVTHDKQVRIRVLAQARGQVAQVRRRLSANNVRVEVVEQPRCERHGDAFTYASDDGSRNVLLEFLGLLIHLVANDRSDRAANDGTDDGAPDGRAGLVPDHPARPGGLSPGYQVQRLL